MGAIIWNLLTWYFRLPSSSSHALIGGLLGAGVTIYGVGALSWTTFVFKVLLVLFTSPLIGMILGHLVFKNLSKPLKYCNTRINGCFKKVQLFSMVLLGLSHSSNDSQKSMGLIVMALLVSGNTEKLKCLYGCRWGVQ